MIVAVIDGHGMKGTTKLGGIVERLDQGVARRDRWWIGTRSKNVNLFTFDSTGVQVPFRINCKIASCVVVSLYPYPKEFSLRIEDIYPSGHSGPIKELRTGYVDKAKPVGRNSARLFKTRFRVNCSRVWNWIL